MNTMYELETRWLERGRSLAWGYIGERRSLESAKKFRKELIERHTDNCITSGYQVRIVRVDTVETRQVIDLEAMEKIDA